MAIYQLDAHTPEVADSAWVADSAQVMGAVKIAKDASVWFGVTVRGDTETIEIGEGSNIQDGSVMHADHGKPIQVGKHVTVGHMVMLHGCTIGDESLIGIGMAVTVSRAGASPVAEVESPTSPVAWRNRLIWIGLAAYGFKIAWDNNIGGMATTIRRGDEYVAQAVELAGG